MKFIYSDGGRAAAGFKGKASDCVVRAVCIAGEYDYLSIYQIAANIEDQNGRKRSAREGLSKKSTRQLLDMLGWKWTPTMRIGSGCTVHLNENELPKGRLVVSVSKHIVAVIDGEIHDTYDPSRESRRCVYGYWRKA